MCEAASYLQSKLERGGVHGRAIGAHIISTARPFGAGSYPSEKQVIGARYEAISRSRYIASIKIPAFEHYVAFAWEMQQIITS